jgi:predicted Zn-ribbon and HTH transcriptional regulator
VSPAHLKQVVLSPYPAKRNLFDDYFDLLGETESPAIAHRWSMICCIGALIGRQAWLPFGPARIFPNIYAMIIGESGTRKSTAIKLAKKILASAGYEQFSAQKTTKEKFLMDLEGLNPDQGQVNGKDVMESLFGGDGDVGGDAREVFIVADEFNDFMSCRDLEFQSLLGSLWDWDDETSTWKHRLKNSQSLSIYQPTISILGGNTHENFTSMFPPEAIGQGFLSRLLLVYCEPTGIKKAIPEDLDERLKGEFVKRLVWIKENFVGPIAWTKEALNIYTILYNTTKPLEDVRFNPYSTRRHVHLIKLCLVCAAVGQKKEIGVQEILLANSILSYLEHFMPKALGEFGRAKNNDVANTIISILSKTLKPVSVKAMLKVVMSNLDRPDDLQRILMMLTDADKVMWVKPSGDREGGYVLKNKVIGEGNKLYVQFNLLKEFHDARL